MPSTHQEKKQDIKDRQVKDDFWKDKLEEDANPAKIC